MRVTRKQRCARQRREEFRNDLKGFLSKSAGIAAAALIAWTGSTPNEAFAMPTGGEVAAGSAVINQAGKVMTIQQQTMQAILNWRAFGIAPDEHVKFIQPGSGAVVLNRVLGNDPSAIFGKLTANGHVFLVNPNGVFFAPGAQVNVGGMTATTLSITDADFMKKNLRFTNDGSAKSVVNQGSITAANSGMVNLLAPEVANEGVIFAKQGMVNLAAGDKATLDFTGDGKVSLAVDPGAIKAQVVNKGLIEADGGVVAMTARANQELTSTVVNQSGIVRAAGFGGQVGAVVLDAGQGTVQVSGTIDTAGQNAKGGTIDVFGKAIELTSTAKIDASGDLGGGKIRVGGDWQGTGDAPHADTVTITKGAALHADANQKGNGGAVAVWSDGTTKFSGDITAKGGALGGDGGKVETSGHMLMVDGNVNAAAEKGKAGEWLLDPENIEIAKEGQQQETGYSFYNVDSLNNSLRTGTGITVTTKNDSLKQAGHILVTSDITSSNTKKTTLTLDADGNININANITTGQGPLDVTLLSARATTGGSIVLKDGKKITTNGGNVTLQGNQADGYAVSGNYGIKIAGTIDTTDTANNTKDGTITLKGKSTESGGIGVLINQTGQLASGGGEIAIEGGAATGGTGITIAGSVNAGDGKATLAGNSIGLTGSVTGTGTLLIKHLDSDTDKTIGIGGGAGSLQLDQTWFTSNISNFTLICIGDKTGTLSIGSNGAAFNSDVELVGKSISVGGNFLATGKDITLETENSAAGSGSITAGTLNLQGSNATFNLTGTHVVAALTGDVKSLKFINANAFSVEELKIKSDLTLTANSGNIVINKAITASSKANVTLSAGNDINVNADIASNGGIIDLTAKAGAIAFTDATVNSGAGNIILKASSSISGSSASITGTGSLTLDNSVGSGAITIGTGSGLTIDPLTFGSDAMFGTGFSEVLIGSATHTGNVSVNDTLSLSNPLTVNGGAIAFGSNSSLNTSGNKALTINGDSIAFAASSGLKAAGGGTIALTVDSISNWNGVDFSGNDNGTLKIISKTANKDFYIGRANEHDQLAVTADGLGRINLGNFENVIIGKDGGAGNVYIADIAASGSAPKNLTINGGAGELQSGTIANSANQTLTLNLSSLSQDNTSVLNIGGKLSLKGSGEFKLNSELNKTINLTTSGQIGNLTVSSKKLNIDTGGVRSSGAITINTDKMTTVSGEVTATNTLIIQTLDTFNRNLTINKQSGNMSRE